ncbi:hypothetical protein P8631_21770, partial [Guyparkeria sp. 1SP6A2]|nr:hypothetical protein [Guyparkeria sp. 1SP6A2]
MLFTEFIVQKSRVLEPFMSQDELLSQAEIDALWKGVSGDDEPAAASSHAQDETRIRPYDPSTQHRVIRERLHA